MTPACATPQHTLVATDLVYELASGARLLDHVSLAVGAGEIVGLAGANGSGKTTLLDVLSGLRRPSAGRIVLQGRDVTRSTPEARARRGLARTFQGCTLFPGFTIGEHLLVADEAGRSQGAPGDAGRHVLERLLFETGLGQRIDEPVEALSAGECRVLDLARALRGGPAVLLLDEPFAGLSLALGRAVAACVEACALTGCGILLVEHRVEYLTRLAGRVIVVHDGRVIKAGAPREVWDDPAVRTAYGVQR